MNKFSTTGIGDDKILEQIRKQEIETWETPTQTRTLVSDLPQYNYDLIIPLEDNKHISLKFTKSLNDTWMCILTDECKKDLEKLLSGNER